MEAETANSKTGNGPASSATTPLVAARHIQTGLYFCLVWINYAMRINLSVGIVAMTDSTTSPNPEIPTYNWTDKSVVLSSFYWGYIVPHFFAGQVSRIYGPKRFLPATMALGAVASMLIPVVAANFGSKGVMGCRIVQGLAQGFMFPALHHLMGKWVPISERSRTASITFSGTPFGTIVAMAVTGLISASRAGWPVSFYLFGSLGFGWILVWMLLGADSPEEHPSISEEERKYIETSLGPKENKKVATPWRSIFSSVPVWAVIVGNLGFSWGYSTLLTEIPNYLNKIMRFDMRTNGLLSAAPYLVFWILCYVSGPSADYLMNSGKMSREGVRKLFNSLGKIS